MNLQNSTYYDILQVPTHATQKNIRASYLKLCKKYHPDVVAQKTNNPLEGGVSEIDGEHNASSDNCFELISEAYKVLSNKEDRQRYDSKILRDLVMQQFLLSDLQWQEGVEKAEGDEVETIQIQVVCRCGIQRWISIDISVSEEILVECEQCSSISKVVNDILE